MNDIKNDLKEITKTSHLGISADRIDSMSTSEAAILLAVTQCSDSLKQVWTEVKSVKDHLTVQDRNQLRMEGKIDHTNGTVREHTADISILKSKEETRAKAEYEGILIERTKKAAVEGVWVIPRPSWKTITAFLSIIAFLGYDKIIAFCWFIVGLIPKHP
jgi:hypothetical protein